MFAGLLVADYPAETVIADLAAAPLTFGSYPQIVLNTSAGTMQLLTSSPNAVYSVDVAGGDNATPVLGSTFGDGNFQPTFVATNPLMGETYIGPGRHTHHPTYGQDTARRDCAGRPIVDTDAEPEYLGAPASHPARGQH